ncbi:MAG TPA: MFS transporter, partial [Sphingomonas sp.]
MRWRLLGARRFLPLFATQFLGAFNDNLFRSAMLFLIAFRLKAGDPAGAALAASISGGVFILPYFLFSSLSGQFADRIDKARIARIVKLAELAILGAGAAGLLLCALPLLYVVLFAMGVHSTVFGPVKYGILPQHLRADELVAGTGMVEAATFLAILFGQIAGGLMATPVAAGAMLAAALAGIAASLFIPPAPPDDASSAIDANIARGTLAILRHAIRNATLLHVIIGISWFFALGAVLTQQFAALVAGLNARAGVASALLALFSVGIAIGALAAARLMRGRITGRPVAPAALSVALLTGWLALAIGAMRPAPGAAVGLAGFLALPGAGWLCGGLVLLAIVAGIYVVPLYALLQTAGEASSRARDVAANNVVNALAMVALTILSI